MTLPTGDFNVRYDWSAGALPPPYQWSYSIRIAADGESELAVIPGYAAPGTPVWTERFTVAPENVEWLHRTMLERELLTAAWSVGDVPIGGSAEWMTVRSGERVIEIPAYVNGERAAAAAAMYGAVKALVPRESWQRMDAAREEYVASRSAERARVTPRVDEPAVRRWWSPQWPLRQRLAIGLLTFAVVCVGAIGALAILVRLTR